MPPVSRLWSIKAAPRVVAFGWLAIMGKILTMDNLWQCKKITVNGCLMCCLMQSVDCFIDKL